MLEGESQSDMRNVKHKQQQKFVCFWRGYRLLACSDLCCGWVLMGFNDSNKTDILFLVNLKFGSHKD